jgi:hypothetical protein
VTIALKTYFVLVAVHLVAVLISGSLWTIVDVMPGSTLRQHLRDIQAVHFGSLYLVPTLLGLAFAFDKLKIPEVHQWAFPAGLGLLVLFSSLGYMFPRPAGVNPFYYWTKGWAMVLAMIGIVCLVIALVWTASVLVIYAVAA